MKSIPVFTLAVVAFVVVCCVFVVKPVKGASKDVSTGMDEVEERSSRIRRFSTVCY